MTTTQAHSLSFDQTDYRDHFVLVPAEPFADLADFVERLAMSQPGWLTRLSMGIADRHALRRGVDDALEGGALGNWKVVDRTSESITFAEDMKIMRYRLTYTLDPAGQVSARTDVVQQTRWFGPIYWLLATPLHRRFLQSMLRRAGGPGSVTRAA